MLEHERLDVYRCSLELVSAALSIAKALPRGHATLADQLRRAAESIPLNVAEGAGRYVVSERAPFYRVARGSALECGAALDVVALVGAVSPPRLEAAKELCVRIVSMLTKLCKQ